VIGVPFLVRCLRTEAGSPVAALLTGAPSGGRAVGESIRPRRDDCKGLLSHLSARALWAVSRSVAPGIPQRLCNESALERSGRGVGVCARNEIKALRPPFGDRGWLGAGRSLRPASLPSTSIPGVIPSILGPIPRIPDGSRPIRSPVALASRDSRRRAGRFIQIGRFVRGVTACVE
jgi:hypothetical protein